MLVIPCLAFAQTEVPSKYWINDDTFDETINPRNGFDDEDDEVIVVEFWADFNKDNAFPDWQKLEDLEGVKYYRVNIATSPRLKKEIIKIHLESKSKSDKDIQAKKEIVNKEIENEIVKAQNEIIDLKKNSILSIHNIAKDLASNIIENISGDKLNESSVQAAVEDVSKKKIGKYL